MANRKQQSTHTFLNGNLKSTLLGLAATGALGMGGASFSQSHSADERTAKLETKVERLENDRKEDTKKLDRVDKRTIRMEEYLKLMGNKMGIKQTRESEE